MWSCASVIYLDEFEERYVYGQKRPEGTRHTEQKQEGGGGYLNKFK